MKNSIDTVGNQTRDLPDCSAVPPAPPRDPHDCINTSNLKGRNF